MPKLKFQIFLKLTLVISIAILANSCNPANWQSDNKQFESTDSTLSDSGAVANFRISQGNALDIRHSLRISPLSQLPDFSSYRNTRHKKLAFFGYLKPLIKQENDKIRQQRRFILTQQEKLLNQDTIKPSDSLQLYKLMVYYRCEHRDLNDTLTFPELLSKADIIPMELALVQAAIESSWGTSYFARIGNNLFGRWCFKPGCGVVPRNRKKGMTHEVAVYRTISDGIRSYMHLLNSNPLFEQLRQERLGCRTNGDTPNGLRMALGLKSYSSRGEHYIEDVQKMIRANQELMLHQHNENPLPEKSSTKIESN